MSIGADLRFRGLVQQMTDERLLARLDTDRVTFYYGIDPTAPSLHVGHLLQLCLLRRLQRVGHRPIALAGGGTGAIGDPGGKSEERPLMSNEELQENVRGIRRQLERFLEFDAPGASSNGAALLVDNREWWSSMNVLEFLRDVGKHFTVNQMLAKEAVRSRVEQPEHGISFPEFSYMLLQAYDFLHLFDRWGCTLQIGGSDQWGNITMGVELVRKSRHAEVFGLTTPLVTKPDGTKYGKTEQGTMWLDPQRTSPYRLYQFLVQTEDAEVGRYLRYFTFLEREQIEALDAETDAHPQRRAAQHLLAREVCALVHGEGEAGRAENASRALFDGTLAELDAAALEQVVADSPSSTISRSALDGEPHRIAGGPPGPWPAGVSLTEALLTSGLVTSKAGARRAVAQGGIYVNDRRETDAERPLGVGDLLHGRYVVLRRGRRNYHILRAE